MKLDHHFSLSNVTVFWIITLFALAVLLYFFEEMRFILVNFIIDLLFIVIEVSNFDAIC
jgi:hypothetical protein